jgi:hypothetical protein
MILTVYVSVISLFPVGLLWCGRMWGAWRKGFVGDWLLLGCTILGFGGFFALTTRIIPVTLLLLLLAGVAWYGMMVAAWWKGWLNFACAILLLSGPAGAIIVYLLLT